MKPRPLRLVSTIKSADDLRVRLAGGAQTSAARATLRLGKPNAVAVDTSGRIFVADPAQRGVVVYDQQAQTAVCWKGNEQFPLFGPAGIALDDSGRLFVTDVYKAHVVVFDRTGTPVALFGKDVLKRPEGIAIDPRRSRVYVGDMKLKQVASFDMRTFAAGPAVGEPSELGRTGPGRLSGPGSVAVNSKGELYVSDRSSCGVQVFDSEGTFIRSVRIECSTARGFVHPIAIGRDDTVYIADVEASTIQAFPKDGSDFLLATMAGNAASPLSRTGIATDQHNRIYVSEQASDDGRVLIFEQRASKSRTSPITMKPAATK
jgi:sugar lactone lactonase YvrE